MLVLISRHKIVVIVVVTYERRRIIRGVVCWHKLHRACSHVERTEAACWRKIRNRRLQVKVVVAAVAAVVAAVVYGNYAEHDRHGQKKRHLPHTCGYHIVTTA